MIKRPLLRVFCDKWNKYIFDRTRCGGGGGGGPGKRVKIRVHHVPSVATKIGVCREKITPHLPKYFPLSCDAKILGEK